MNDKTISSMEDLLSNPFWEQKELLSQSVAPQSEEKRTRLFDILPKENKMKAIQLAKQIDPTNHQAMIFYGTQAQGKLLSFSHSMLEQVQKDDIGEVGQIISGLMEKLDDINLDDLKIQKLSFISRMFGKTPNSIQEVLSKFQKTDAQIDRISVKLERSKNVLLEDIKLLDMLYENNKEYFHVLNIYIAAGELKLKELNEEVIPAMEELAKKTRDQMKLQDVFDTVQFANHLDKRLYDLKVSREITIQSASQIRLIQNTNQILVEKIQLSIMTAIPLWKNQVAIALTLIRRHHAVEAQKQVSKTTNKLLSKNVEILKSNTIETAKENELGLVDIETLKKTQEGLVSTLEETLRIQEEGRSKRRLAENEFVLMSTNLKKKLINIKGDS